MIVNFLITLANETFILQIFGKFSPFFWERDYLFSNSVQGVVILTVGAVVTAATGVKKPSRGQGLF